VQKAHYWHNLLLRPRRERPRRCTANQRYEFSPSHCLPVLPKFRVQLRPSKQERELSETTAGCGNVRRTNSARLTLLASDGVSFSFGAGGASSVPEISKVVPAHRATAAPVHPA
jgi:hypothetical protein